MKLFAIVLYRVTADGDEPKALRVAYATQLDSFGYFQRRYILDQLRAGTRLVIERTPMGIRQSVEINENIDAVCHAYRSFQPFPSSSNNAVHGADNVITDDKVNRTTDLIESKRCTTDLSEAKAAPYHDANYGTKGPKHTWAACVVSDHEYPALTAHRVLLRAMNAFASTVQNTSRHTYSAATTPLRQEQALTNVDVDATPEELVRLLNQAQNPGSVDKLVKIQQDLHEIQDIMHQNITQVLRRGETLESLSAKADDLGIGAKLFYSKAAAQNRCCKIY